MIIYTTCTRTENYDVTAVASNGFFILAINYVSVDLSARARVYRPYNNNNNVWCSGGIINLWFVTIVLF